MKFFLSIALTILVSVSTGSAMQKTTLTAADTINNRIKALMQQNTSLISKINEIKKEQETILTKRQAKPVKTWETLTRNLHTCTKQVYDNNHAINVLTQELEKITKTTQPSNHSAHWIPAGYGTQGKVGK